MTIIQYFYATENVKKIQIACLQNMVKSKVKPGMKLFCIKHVKGTSPAIPDFVMEIIWYMSVLSPISGLSHL